MSKFTTNIRDFFRAVRFVLSVISFVLRSLLASVGPWRMPATVHDLHYPVLLIRPDHQHAYAVGSSTDLRYRPKASSDFPEEGMIAIDTNFDMYTLRNVESREGDFKQIARILFASNMRYKYSFELKRRKSGLALGKEEVLKLGGRFAENRSALAEQATLQGMLDVLKITPQMTESLPEEKPATDNA